MSGFINCFINYFAKKEEENSEKKSIILFFGVFFVVLNRFRYVCRCGCSGHSFAEDLAEPGRSRYAVFCLRSDGVGKLSLD